MARTNELYRDMLALDNQAAALMQEWPEEPSKEQREEVKKLDDQAREMEQRILGTQEGDNLRKRFEERKTRYNTPVDNIGFGTPGDNPNNGASKKDRILEDGQTWGDYFVEHVDIKGWQERAMPNGYVNEKQRVQSPVVQIAAAFKALITGVSDTSGGAMVRTQYENLVQLPYRPLTIRDIITNGTTGSDTVEYPRVTTLTNNAAAVAEATAASGATGAKPESDMILEKVTTTVKTIAHWIPVTKRALSDAGQLRTLINSFLMYGLEEELEDQIVAGDGTGENFTGIMNTTGTLTQAWDTNLLKTTRKARTKIRVEGKAQPNAWLFHPDDFEVLDLLQDNEARFYWGGPLVLGNPRLWGLPIVESEAKAAGYAILGDFKQAVLWDREQAGIQVTDSHQDFFIRNLVAMLAEMRAAFGVLRPAAFVEVDVVA